MGYNPPRSSPPHALLERMAANRACAGGLLGVSAWRFSLLGKHLIMGRQASVFLCDAWSPASYLSYSARMTGRDGLPHLLIGKPVILANVCICSYRLIPSTTRASRSGSIVFRDSTSGLQRI